MNDLLGTHLNFKVATRILSLRYALGVPPGSENEPAEITLSHSPLDGNAVPLRGR